MANQTIREAAAKHRIKLWEIARALGITDGAFSRRLRVELPVAEQERILTIIDRLRKDGDAVR